MGWGEIAKVGERPHIQERSAQLMNGSPSRTEPRAASRSIGTRYHLPRLIIQPPANPVQDMHYAEWTEAEVSVFLTLYMRVLLMGCR
jgi:hypothetical protein